MIYFNLRVEILIYLYGKHYLTSYCRYFYGELQQLAHGVPPYRTIFVNNHTGKLPLRSNVSIHLVLSDAPNGDAKEFLPPDTNNYLSPYDAVSISYYFLFSI